MSARVGDRRARRVVFAAGVVLAAAACGGEAPDAGVPGEAGVEGGTAGVVRASAPERLIGVFAFGSGLMEIEPCDGSPMVAVQGPEAGNLLQVAETLVPGVEPIETVFVDVVVTRRAADPMGPAAGYDQVVDVLAIRRVAFEGFGCGTPGPEDLLVSVLGHEPSWSFVIDDAGASLTTPQGTQPITETSITHDIEGVTLSGSLEGVGTVFLEVTAVLCQDPMSGAVTHARAVFRTGTQTREGCAWLGTAYDSDVTPLGS